MSRQTAQYGIKNPVTHSMRYNRPSQPGVSTSNATVTHLTRAVQSGSMNLSTTTTNHSRTRPLSRFDRISPERPIKPNYSTSTTHRNTRLTSQDRSNGLTNGVSKYQQDPKPTVYSLTSTTEPITCNDNETSRLHLPTIKRQISHSSSINESKLINGGICGLQNLGNTCFMNSALQCLSNTKPLLIFCLQDNLDSYLNTSSTSSMKGALMKEYANLIRKMWLLPEGRSLVSPLSFKNTIGKFAPRFIGYFEQDSQEFLRFLLQGLSEDVNRVREKPTPIIVDEKAEERMNEKYRAKASWDRCFRYENSPLVDIFGGQLKSTLECSHCHYRSITFDMFWDLSLPLPRDKSNTNLQECIQLFMSKEILDGDEKPTCAKCKQKRQMTKQLSIQKCPKILVLHLKRFSQMRSRTKLDIDVDFPITNLRLGNLPDVMSESYEGSIPTYNLFGISNHTGTIYSGHYIAQCKHPYTNEWHEFNDSYVHPISDTARIITSNAYVLFYERNGS